MYAAAGGASLASRQARQRQRQQNNKNKVLQQQAKLAQAKTSGVITPTRAQQSRQFHQLPSSYLRTPQTESRKLSATQSKLLLPIVEGNNQQPQSLCQPHHQQFEPYTRPVSPRPSIRPNDPRTYQFLTKSATATLPLNSQTADCTPPATPIISVTNSGPKFGGDCRINDPSQYAAAAYSHILPVPQDSIIVTPATPLTSPGHRVAASGGPEQPGTLQLERKCSFYRVRRSDAFEYDGSPTTGPTTTNQAQNQADPHLNDGICYGLPNGGSGHKWAQHATYCAYCEDGSYICDHVECAQGRAAWLERGRRCSVQDSNPASCHRRWVKRNRIQDSSLGGSSDDEDLLGVLRGPSSFANAFLYVGLGTIAIGLVIAFVGTGEKGFKTVELRLIGPSLIGIGLICCILRICFCICPSHCLSSSKRARKKNSNKIDADHTTSLLRGESKRVSIAKGPHQKFPLTHKSRSNSKMINEGMEALRQIATTSLFLQNEQKPSTNRIVPIIKEPEKSAEAPLEMKKLDTTLNICDITDDEDDDDDCAEPFHSSSYHNQNESLVLTHSKLARQRLPTNQSPQQHQQKPQDSETLLMETSLMIVNPMPSTSSSSRANIAHSPPPIPSSSQGLDLPLPKSNRHQQHMPAPMVHTPPPGTSSGYLQQPRVGLHPGAYPSTQAHHSRNPPPLLSSSGSYSAPNPNKTTQTVTIVEPELVLSPAKLGQ